MKYWQHLVARGRLRERSKSKNFLAYFALIFFFSFFHVSGMGYSQSISINVDSVELREVIKDIERQSDYRFFYSDGLSDLNRKVTARINAQSIHNVMSHLLAGTNLSYRLVNEYLVMLAPKEAMHDVQQGITVSGTVTDADGPLPGVTVTIRGASHGTVTDGVGRFSITVPDAQSVLVFTFLGYRTQEFTVGNQTVFDVFMVEAIGELQELVVIGYGTANRLTVTGAVSTISTEDLLRSPVPNLGNMLVGQVTGLSAIQSTALPGADDPELFVRGIGTLNAANSRPLILVDGVERNFFQLDPNEIESISILKDASATAVFGVQGANGVIIVTTRRGADGPPRISVSLSGGMQIPLRVLDFVDSYNFCVAYNEMMGTDVFSDELMDKFRTQEEPLLYPSHNWIKEMLRPFALQTQNNINVSGGNEVVKYFASLGYFHQDGLLKEFQSDFHQNYGYSRYNYRTNFDINATPSTKLSVSLAGISGTRSEPRNQENPNSLTANFRNIYWGLPFSSAGIVDGKLVDANPQYVTSNINQMRSPFAYWYGRGIKDTSINEMTLDFSIEQGLDVILKGLSASIKYSYNSRYTHIKERTYNVPIYTPWEIGNTNNWQNVDPNADPTEVVLVTNADDTLWGYNESWGGRTRRFYWEGAIRYNQRFGKHTVTGLFLGNMKKTFYLDNDRYNYIHIPLGSLGFVGRATYNYSQKYLLELNAGYNGSENFAEGKRFGFFPAMSLGWVLSEEDFMKNNLSFISFLKIRSSIGMVGSDYVGQNRFLYLPDVWNPNTAGVNAYFFGVENNPQMFNGAQESAIGNPDVTWETAIKQNYAIDVNFLQNRLSISADRFFEKRRDILAQRNTVPEFVAVDLPVANIGKVDNQGFELSVKWQDRFGANRQQQNSYRLGFNVSYSRNKIVYMDEITYDNAWRQQTGRRVGQNFGYVFERLYEPADFPEALKYNANLKPGDAKYSDLNDDDEIDANDVRNIGFSRFPDYIFSFNAGFSYRGFDFSMLWQGATNVSRNLSALYRIPFGPAGNRNLMLHPYENRYVSESLTPNATYPRFAQETRAWNYDEAVTNSFWVRDASYLRLKNAEIGYSLNAQFLTKMGIQRMRLSLSGTNLLTFDRLIFIDPEETGNNPEYPNMAIINFGINFTF